jgi:hypothetical protein
LFSCQFKVHIVWVVGFSHFVTWMLQIPLNWTLFLLHSAVIILVLHCSLFEEVLFLPVLPLFTVWGRMLWILTGHVECDVYRGLYFLLPIFRKFISVQVPHPPKGTNLLE